MPNHKSSIKRAKQIEKQNLINRALRSNLRSTIKKFRSLIEKQLLEEAQSSYPKIQKTIDKAVTKGILKRGTAERYKSRLTHALQKQQEQATSA